MRPVGLDRAVEDLHQCFHIDLRFDLELAPCNVPRLLLVEW